MFSKFRSRLSLLVQNFLRYRSKNHLSFKLVDSMRKIHFLRGIWHKYFRVPILDTFNFRQYLEREGHFSKTPTWSHEQLLKINSSEILFEGLAQIVETFEPTSVVKNQKIVIINCSMASGGAERQVINTLVGLKRRFYDATFIGEYIGYRDDLDFHLPTLEANEIDYLQGPLTDHKDKNMYKHVSAQTAAVISKLSPDEISRLLGMVEKLRELRPEIVHLWQDQTSVLHGIAALIARVPRIILSGRNINPTHFAYETSWLKPGYIALSQAENVCLTNNSEIGAQSYEKWLDFAPGTIRVLRNGIDLGHLKELSLCETHEFRAQLDISPEKRIICGIFRMSEEKRPRLWLEVARELAKADDNFVFVIAGDGHLFGKTKANAVELGIEKKTIFLGETAKIPELLSASESLLLTSIYEGTPNVLLEAAWYGVPTVTTNAGGAKECLLANQTGIVVNSDNPRKLANAVVKSSKLVKNREAFKNQSRDFVKTKFGIERMIDETIDIYFGS